MFKANTDEALLNAVNNGLDFEICENEPYGINFYTAALSMGSPELVRACIHNGASADSADMSTLFSSCETYALPPCTLGSPSMIFSTALIKAGSWMPILVISLAIREPSWLRRAYRKESLISAIMQFFIVPMLSPVPWKKNSCRRTCPIRFSVV